MRGSRSPTRVFVVPLSFEFEIWCLSRKSGAQDQIRPTLNARYDNRLLAV